MSGSTGRSTIAEGLDEVTAPREWLISLYASYILLPSGRQKLSPSCRKAIRTLKAIGFAVGGDDDEEILGRPSRFIGQDNK